MKSELKKIVIIEDNPDVGSGFELLINATENYKVIQVFENCKDALVDIKTLKPDIVLMDIDLPGMNGIEGTSIIKSLLPKTEIIIITVFENSERVFGAMNAGASGYLTKNNGYKELIDALDEVVKGGAPMSAKIARMVVKSFAKETINNPLSKQESKVLSQLAEGKSYKSISNLLDVTLDTVKFHIKNIYIKLQVNNKEDAISEGKKNKYI
ncbi:MAG TPA: response regulator transcription factor [Chitinophagales bacterium]|nr:response regulator transcription factor [Chitinophagales bacterium]HMV03295.1 response regulator transcription factor [Chitinophagales bacterium]HMW95579.1 response regulator transcription factor [Chitinophagales bacterium]HMY41807.1 response regulator transcription factor [Chitinophagales bacterium]HMZ68074.1 response regulator transcription factor [Chitinophagales bacterium]